MDANPPKELHAKPPSTARRLRRPPLLSLLTALWLASAVEPLRPKRVRRRVASHRDASPASLAAVAADEDEPRPDISLATGVAPVTDLAHRRLRAESTSHAEPEPVDLAEPTERFDLNLTQAADVTELAEPVPHTRRRDRFAGHGYGEVPGLRWSDDVGQGAASRFARDPFGSDGAGSDGAGSDGADELGFDDVAVPRFMAEAELTSRTPDSPPESAPEVDLSHLVDWHAPDGRGTHARTPARRAERPTRGSTRSTGPLQPEQFAARLQLASVRDQVDVLMAEIERFLVTDDGDREIECVIRPTLGWTPDDFGGNRRHDFYWGDAEQLVLQVWAELCKRVWIEGSRLEAWLRIDGVGLFVPVTLDTSCTVWKFMNEFRSAIELAQR